MQRLQPHVTHTSASTFSVSASWQSIFSVCIQTDSVCSEFAFLIQIPNFTRAQPPERLDEPGVALRARVDPAAAVRRPEFVRGLVPTS